MAQEPNNNLGQDARSTDVLTTRTPYSYILETSTEQAWHHAYCATEEKAWVVGFKV
jgi:hypothetical protein